MRTVDEQLEDRILNAGYVRTKDCDGSARYVKGDNTALVSGYMVLVRSAGMWRPFSIERALKTGFMLLERLARIIPGKWNEAEDTTNYELLRNTEDKG